MRLPKLALVGAVVALLIAAPAAASAQTMRAELSPDERGAGLWYADKLGFDQIREQGLTGKGITIAVVDDAINLNAPELQGADIEVMGQYCRDPETGAELPAVTDDIERRHGTDVVSMLVGNGVAGDGGPGTRGIVPEAKILFYAADSNAVDEDGVKVCEAYNPVTGMYEKDREYDLEDLGSYPRTVGAALALGQAVEDGADVVSISSVHGLMDSAPWTAAQTMAMRAGVPIVAGTTNPVATGTVMYALPYFINGVVAVSGIDSDAKLIQGVDIFGSGPSEASGAPNLAFVAPASQVLVPSSDDGWAPALGSGTSLATPLVAGTIALGLEKYPAATGFQVLQSMIRTTSGNGLAEPVWNGPKYGYGIARPLDMLAVDPTQFLDENPLFIYSGDDPRCGGRGYEDCAWALMLPEAADLVMPGTPSSEIAPKVSDGWPALAILFGGIAGLGVLLAAITVPIVLVRSKRKRETQLNNSDPTEGN